MRYALRHYFTYMLFDAALLLRRHRYVIDAAATCFFAIRTA